MRAAESSDPMRNLALALIQPGPESFAPEPGGTP